MLIDLLSGIESARLAVAESTQPPPGERPDMLGAWHGDAGALAAALRRRITGEVRFDDGSRALYATDASNYRQIPIGVVVPRTIDDVVATVEEARRYGAPILARGGGTSLAGECCNVAVVIDFSKYLNALEELNVEERYAIVQPGIVLDDLRDAAQAHGLTFGPDPATHDHNTLGGMLGNNSCGMHAQFAGKCEENTEALEILTYDGLRTWVGAYDPGEIDRIIAQGGRKGEIFAALRDLAGAYGDAIEERFPDIPRRVSGFALDELLPKNGFHVARSLVGSECTCVLILRAKLKLIPNPDKRVIAVLGFNDIYDAGDHVKDVNPFEPIALEGLDDELIDYMKIKRLHTDDLNELPEGKGWLMVEFGSRESIEDATAQAQRCIDEMKGKVLSSKLVTDEGQQKRLWEVRESGLGATAKVPGKPPNWPGWEDSAVPPDRVGEYLRELRALYDRYGYEAALYGHFGQGCIHCRVSFDLETAEGIAAWRRFLVEASHLVTRYGGSLSGEHGDGQARGEFLPIMYGDRVVEGFRTFKRIWDPDGKMNPGKVVDAYPATSNLRMGPHYRPWDPPTRFTFEQQDRGSFAVAANRCVGVGKCRRHDSGVMCPSYRATREEQHSTRGRARLLFEMLEGDPLHDGWQSDAVHEALDLCLACKGCKGECPVNVDMASYKAEFLSHYYEKRRRPLHAYAFGLMPWWAHLASFVPSIANAVSASPLGALAKRAIGIAPQRQIPPFATQSFKRWYSQRPRRGGGKRVILWADTWNGYFHTSTAQHAVEVLEAAGYEVVIPQQTLCCGRPLYDYGMLDLAKTLLRQIVVALRDEIEAGTPVVALEPSCASVFRDELLEFFPNEDDARRLSASVSMLGDFLHRAGWTPPPLHRTVVLHGHCHEKSLLGLGGTEALLTKMETRLQTLDSGCCGMAGAFGFERDHYDVSIACGERGGAVGLLPSVRAAAADAIILSDGFSCREQVIQTTDRQPLHLADVLWLALTYGAGGPPGERPELAAMPDIAAARRRAAGDAATALLVLGAAGVAAGVRAIRTRSAR